DEVKANRGRGRALQRLAHVDEVAERLAHLVALVADHSGVHPGAGERRLAGQRLRLRALRLVVTEDEVAPATVNVDLRPEVVRRHHRALDVPARAAVAELRRPRRLVRLRSTPYREVERVALGVWPDLTEQLFLAQLAHH